jgi:DNA-binding HxlR family transcriptional regulator/putative sterol carrier protein
VLGSTSEIGTPGDTILELMARRTYNQYCATARTLDVVGERWTLLVVRELLTGPKRFRDLLDSLRGIGTGLLASRLKYLEAEGIVHRVTLPPPAGTPAYALTEAGAELESVVMALSRWGLTWAFGERREGEDFHAGWAVLGMQALFDSDAARDVAAVYEFRVDEDVFHARIEHGEIESVHGPAQRPDAVITADGEAFHELAAGRLSLRDALREGRVSTTGDRGALRQLGAVFRRPRARVRS